MLEKADAASPSGGCSLLYSRGTATVTISPLTEDNHFRAETVLSVRGLISFQVRKQKLGAHPSSRGYGRRRSPVLTIPSYFKKQDSELPLCQHIPVELWRWSPKRNFDFDLSRTGQDQATGAPGTGY